MKKWTPRQIIFRAQALGLSLAISESGNIKLGGDASLITDRVTTVIKENKSELLAYLRDCCQQCGTHVEDDQEIGQYNEVGRYICSTCGKIVPQPTCCKCGSPAEYHSPSGWGYCAEHYWCCGGHRPVWRRWHGIWVCECVITALAPQMPQFAS